MTHSAAKSTSIGSVAAMDQEDRRLAQTIETAFARCFARDYNTQLIGGAVEPLYQPASATQPARLLYREDFPASALHEVAHWCVAGDARRQLEDFGYHYIAGPRTPDQQDAFFALELWAQSLEKQFAQAAGLDFIPSADNLLADSAGFGQAIDAYESRLLEWLASPAGSRARRFIQSLKRSFSTGRETLRSEVDQVERSIPMAGSAHRGRSVD